MARQELLRLANSLYESSANPDTQRIPREFAPDQRPLAAFGQNGFFEYGETTDVSETTTGGAYHTLMSNKEVLDLGGDPVTLSNHPRLALERKRNPIGSESRKQDGSQLGREHSFMG